MNPGSLSNLRIEKLCTHHDATKFDCGDEFYNLILREYQASIVAEEFVTVLALVDGPEVAGYIAYRDFAFRSAESGNLLRLFFVPAWAVSKPFKGTDVHDRLIDSAIAAIGRRESAGPPYDGVACIPGSHRAVGRILRRMGFLPLTDDEVIWWWPM